MSISYKLVRRQYKAVGDRPAYLMLLEINDSESNCRDGLARVRSAQTCGVECWSEVDWLMSPGGVRRWQVGGLPLGYTCKQNRDWSLRGWLSFYLRDAHLPDAEIDTLARKLERAAGLPDSGAHETYERPGAWVNSCGVVYPYADYGRWWRPATCS
jgi:hypothetical protein